MKPSKYNYILYGEGYGFWYNSLSGQYFRLSEGLSRKIESLMNSIEILDSEVQLMYTKLRESGFIVDDDFDELQFIREQYDKAVNSKNYMLVILPTLNCNFKCWYCIQDHIPSLMNVDTLESIKRHIDFMIDKEKIDSLRIEWFGGEPFMYFKQVIEPLSHYAIERCKDSNIPFTNSATTNAYFIDDKVSAKLSGLRFKQFQITIDGEKANHDKVKFMKGCPSAFEHTLENINRIVSDNGDIHVFLRINYTHTTLSKKIVAEVNQHIDSVNRGHITIIPKKVWQEKVDKNFSPILKEIMNDFEDSGFMVNRIQHNATFTPCYVSKKYYNAINFNGNVVKCTACNDIYDKETHGRLNADGSISWSDNYDVACQQASFENERCLACKLLPLCMGLCPRDFLAGKSFCKKDTSDGVFETDLLDFLIHDYKINDKCD